MINKNKIYRVKDDHVLIVHNYLTTQQISLYSVCLNSVASGECASLVTTSLSSSDQDSILSRTVHGFSKKIFTRLLVLS
jgi:hypothetical protein